MTLETAHLASSACVQRTLLLGMQCILVSSILQIVWQPNWAILRRFVINTIQQPSRKRTKPASKATMVYKKHARNTRALYSLDAHCTNSLTKSCVHACMFLYKIVCGNFQYNIIAQYINFHMVTLTDKTKCRHGTSQAIVIFGLSSGTVADVDHQQQVSNATRIVLYLKQI